MGGGAAGSVVPGSGQGGPDGNGLVQHFFPWWMEEAYVADKVTDTSDEEQALMQRYGLGAAQIGFRRGLEASYRGLRSQEFAEDAESCFKATGDCCFDVEAGEGPMTPVDAPKEAGAGGAL